jgi:hypothetical protein
LEFSSDGSRLWYQIGQAWWELETRPGSNAEAFGPTGEKDIRFADTMRFYEALKKAGSPVTLITYPEEGHEISSRAVAERHVQTALDFFRSALPAR